MRLSRAEIYGFDIEQVKRLLLQDGYQILDLTDRKRGPLWARTPWAHYVDDQRFFSDFDRRYGTYFKYAPSGSRSFPLPASWFWVPGYCPGMGLLRNGLLEDSFPPRGINVSANVLSDTCTPLEL